MSNRITEIKTIKIDQDCKSNPVYIAWLGTNVGWNHWLFSKVQTEAVETAINGEFSPYQEDIENAIGTSEIISKTATPELIIGARVSVDDARGLRGLIISPSVLMLSNNDTWQDEGCKWVRVKVQPGAFKILDTDTDHSVIEITLELPQINSQSQ